MTQQMERLPANLRQIEETLHPLAVMLEYPLALPEVTDVNDASWGHLYGAIIDGIGLSPKNFQLLYPFTSWDWPVANRGYTQAAQWDFCATVPQYSATGAYVSSGTTFNDAYQQLLNVVKADTSDPALEGRIAEARNILTIATNDYIMTYDQAQADYVRQTGGTNMPPFSEWLGSAGAISWKTQLAAARQTVEAKQRVLDQLLSETQTPGLIDAKERFRNQEYYTKYQNSELSGFPAVPGYSLSMDSTTWLQRVKAGGGMSGEVSFQNRSAQYDYSKTWAGGSSTVGNAFWSVNVGGSWERIDEFARDDNLEVTVSFKAWDQITIQSGRWYNGAFVSSVRQGPFIRGYSPYGSGSDSPVWGKKGFMTAQKVGMIVCYKPSFTIKVSEQSFSAFSEKWQVCGGLQIGPFRFSGGGGSTTSGWRRDAATKTFTGTSTGEGAQILGTTINLINPAE